MAGRATGSSLGLSDGPFVKSELFRALGQLKGVETYLNQSCFCLKR